MTVDVKSKVYVVVTDEGCAQDVTVAVFSKREDAVAEIEYFTGRKEADWEFDDGDIIPDTDTAMLIQECELH